jgi:hypothetical protein
VRPRSLGGIPSVCQLTPLHTAASRALLLLRSSLGNATIRGEISPDSRRAHGLCPASLSDVVRNLSLMTDWERVTSAVGLALSGESRGGRDALSDCWSATTEADHAQRCVIAHYLADLQLSVDEEVRWDERALSEHAQVADEDLAPVGIASAAGLAASLHLNLGDGYLRQGRVDGARAQLDAGMRARNLLPIDGYGSLIRSGLDRLEERVHQAENR